MKRFLDWIQDEFGALHILDGGIYGLIILAALVALLCGFPECAAVLVVALGLIRTRNTIRESTHRLERKLDILTHRMGTIQQATQRPETPPRP